MLTDPEIDSFTYPIANRPALAATLAEVVGRPASEMAALLAEVDDDPVLRGALRQPLKRRMWTKRVPEPRAYHQACWAVVRALRPGCVVETGILDGMASTVVLAALERDAAQGAPGQLVSFDIMPGAGAMVPAHLRARWTPVYRDATEALDEVIGDRRIGFLVSDSLPDVRQIRAEVDVALRHRAEVLVALTTWGSLGELGWPGGAVHRFTEQPVGHFYEGVTFAIAQL